MAAATTVSLPPQCWRCSSEQRPHQSPPAEAAVVEVIDGDTIDVTIDGVSERVRLIGIDAPEMDTCGGPEAREHLAALLAVHATVVLTEGRDGEERDRYDRMLRYVTDGTPGPGFDAGLSMITDGYAIARYDSRDGTGGTGWRISTSPPTKPPLRRSSPAARCSPSLRPRQRHRPLRPLRRLRRAADFGALRQL